MQLPMYQASQVRVAWVKSREDLKEILAATYAFNIPELSRGRLELRVTARLMKSNKVVGYYCKDSFNREFAMDSEILKRALGKEIRVYNIKLSSDNRLIHEPKGDRLGLDVPPEVFFNYEDRDLGIRMYYDANEKCVILLSTRTRKYLKFRINLHDGNRAWFIRCYAGDFIDFRKVRDVSDIIYRDRGVGCLDEFIQEMIKLAKASEAKKTTANDDDDEYFESQWGSRFSYLDDYRHGHSEDSEDAYHSLMYLKRTYKRYGKTWDLDF